MVDISLETRGLHKYSFLVGAWTFSSFMSNVRGTGGSLMDPWLIIGYIVIIILLFIIAVITSALWPTVIGAVWIPTPRETARKMLELAKVTPEDTVVDLGSGDGRIIVMAAEEFGATALGIEADPLRVLWSRSIIWRHGLRDRVKVVWGNFYSQSIAAATVVTVFQGQAINKNLQSKLSIELKPGTRVVSYSFSFEDWDPVETQKKPNLYLYVIG